MQIPLTPSLVAPPPVASRARTARWLRFLGPATMVSVGYMDPGNWATDLEGGARFGYRLLWVLVVANAMALLLQTLSARLGIASGLDLAQACGRHYPKPVSFTLWLLAETAIVACDLAEVLGSAIALNLLFHVPMLVGAMLTVLDVLLVLGLQRRGMRTLHAIVCALVVTIGACLLADLVMARPSGFAIAGGLIPRLDGASLYVAVAMLGATVMPHNLYLHSALVRRDPATAAKTRARLGRSFVATAIALNVALLVNVTLLVLAAAAFGSRGIIVTDLGEAFRLLAPTVGVAGASVLFAAALLCSGQSATITGTMAGQIIMTGFLGLKVSPAVRRMLTRGLAVVPAVVVLAIMGDRGTMPLLVASQVILSLQLPFAVVPLLRFTASPTLMGAHASGRATRIAAGLCATVVLAANAALVVHLVREWSGTAPALAWAVAVAAAFASGFLLVIGRIRLVYQPR